MLIKNVNKMGNLSQLFLFVRKNPQEMRIATLAASPLKAV
jgi:hypothetical protein